MSSGMGSNHVSNSDPRWLHVIYGVLGMLASVWIGAFLLSITPKGVFPDLPIFVTMLTAVVGGFAYSFNYFFDIMDNPKELL